MDFSGFNFWELLVAALSTLLIGAIWYSPKVFGKAWQNRIGLSDEDLKKGSMLLIFGLTFVLNFFVALAISLFVEIFLMMGATPFTGGLFAAVLALFFVATTFGVNYLFARKSMQLYLIDVGYMVVAFFVMGVIIGAWY